MARSPTETIRFLTLEELARLFAAMRASPRDRALFLIAYRHGLGASEVGLLRTGREQAGKMVAILPPPAPAIQPRRPWWRRLAG
jgi:integrase